MTYQLYLASIYIFLSGCGISTASEPKQFFENATRRAPTNREAAFIAKVRGCTAFYVSNAQRRHFLISGRHCFQYQIGEECRKGNIVFSDLQTGLRGKCKRIVAASDKYDIAMMEAKFSFEYDENKTLRLTSYQPKLNTQLQMLGFPTDPDRKGEATVTENCWVLKENTPSPFLGTEFPLWDPASLHNCSTYGGNSGGPIVRANSRDVVGLPLTYVPDSFELRISTVTETAASLSNMSAFVARHKALLLAKERVTVSVVDNDDNTDL